MTEPSVVLREDGFMLRWDSMRDALQWLTGTDSA
jgi:hypothetical protein